MTEPTTEVTPAVPEPVANAPTPAAPVSTVAGAVAAVAPEPVAPKSFTETLYPDQAAADAAQREKDAAEVAPPEPVKTEAELAAEAEAAKAAKPAEAEPVDPASYTITLPENFTVDDAIMSDFRKAAAAAKLDNSAAQGLMDLYVKSSTAAAVAQDAAFTQLRAQMKAEVDKMPEFIGEAREKSLQTIGRAIDEFGDPSVREALETNLLGDHPGFIRMILNMSSALVEGAPTLIGKPAGQGNQRKTLGQTLYPNQK